MVIIPSQDALPILYNPPYCNTFPLCSRRYTQTFPSSSPPPPFHYPLPPPYTAGRDYCSFSNEKTKRIHFHLKRTHTVNIFLLNNIFWTASQTLPDRHLPTLARSLVGGAKGTRHLERPSIFDQERGVENTIR